MGELKDQFGRVHDYLRISLIERCNLRCTYCMPLEGIELRDKSHFMTPEEIIQITEIFVELGVKKIRLTGGEPLIRKGFDFILEGLSKLSVELCMTTNAVRIDKHIDELKKANLLSLNVSLDSLQRSRFKEITRRDEFEKVIENINTLSKNNFNLKINVVLMKGINDDEVIDFLRWGKEKNIEVRFIEFMPFEGNSWDSNKKVSLNTILDKVNDEFEEYPNLIIAKPNETSKRYTIQSLDYTFGVISSVTSPFCSTCNRIRLTADGKIKNCLFSNSELDLLSEIRKGKEIKSLIRNSILNKKKALGGVDELSNENVAFLENRSMVTIGG